MRTAPAPDRPRMAGTGFWSGETLKYRRATVVTPFDPELVDSSTYTLTMGRELYVPPTTRCMTR